MVQSLGLTVVAEENWASGHLWTVVKGGMSRPRPRLIGRHAFLLTSTSALSPTGDQVQNVSGGVDPTPTSFSESPSKDRPRGLWESRGCGTTGGGRRVTGTYLFPGCQGGPDSRAEDHEDEGMGGWGSGPDVGLPRDPGTRDTLPATVGTRRPLLTSASLNVTVYRKLRICRGS